MNKFNYFLNRGYSKDEAIFITVKLPVVYSYSIDSLNEKFSILSGVGLDKEVLNRPSYLMQSVELTFARMNFLKDKKVVFDHKAFNSLVMSSTDFKKKFGIDNEEVRERYPYKK